MSFYERHKPVILGSVLAIVLVFLSLGLTYPFTCGLTLSDRLSAMQLFLSAVAFTGVFIALMVAIAQFRRSMAKPLIKVAFNEREEKQTSLTCKETARSGQFQLWLINEGNAISRYFQIDFNIPEHIGKQSSYVYITRRDSNYIISIPTMEDIHCLLTDHTLTKSSSFGLESIPRNALKSIVLK